MRTLSTLLLCLLAACQPAVQPAAPRDVAPQLLAEAIRVSDGTQLPLKSWLPADGSAPKAVILALHGFNDYSHAFALAGEDVAAHGLALYAYDQRGFGANKPQGIWPAQDNLRRDLADAMLAVRKAHADVPLYVLGESMGAAVVIDHCAQAGCEDAEGLILSAPAFWGDDTLSGFYRAGLWVMAHLIPASEWTGEDLDIMASDNLEILYAMGTDPNVIKETRVDSVYGLVGLMGDAYAQVPELSRPVLLLYGAKDQVIPPLPVAKAVNALSAPHSVGYYANGYHMLLRDKQRGVVARDIMSWIDNRYRPLPSSADMGWKEELLGVE